MGNCIPTFVRSFRKDNRGNNAPPRSAADNALEEQLARGPFLEPVYYTSRHYINRGNIDATRDHSGAAGSVLESNSDTVRDVGVGQGERGMTTETLHYD